MSLLPSLTQQTAAVKKRVLFFTFHLVYDFIYNRCCESKAINKELAGDVGKTAHLAHCLLSPVKTLCFGFTLKTLLDLPHVWGLTTTRPCQRQHTQGRCREPGRGVVPFVTSQTADFQKFVSQHRKVDEANKVKDGLFSG